jgi:putative FmdB family regulatory protein
MRKEGVIMPLYDYRCQSCGEEEHDVLTKLKDADSKTCPSCSAPMKRLIALTARGVIAGGGAADHAGSRPRVRQRGSYGDIPTAGRDGSIYKGGRKILNPDGSKA